MNRQANLRTLRLTLRPVSWQNMDDMRRIKGNATAFGRMLGGVRTPGQVEAEMAEDMAFWAQKKIGIFVVFEGESFVGITGFHERPDGRGLALRLAFMPEVRGRGLAQEAANAAIAYARGQGIPRFIAVASEDNLASQAVLRSLGMRVCDTFQRAGQEMRVYEMKLTNNAE